ncbi:hypothetical protein GCM10009557_24630 [Virgisporangium ochraceum]|uniref:Uncharacterized protein n=1 Tax=Virgisporangium ochraceum TaxID=65505 RepID=A0A8J3ZUQ8_9ACTN|nr:hypothetical protein [Virgisporangium ochraceum]GIJ68453.1 hypothetical protein Voc01_033700 [Virgisporangium ochraceum]
MTTNEDKNVQPDDEAAEIEVVAHSGEETEDPPSCFGIHIEK